MIPIFGFYFWRPGRLYYNRSNIYSQDFPSGLFRVTIIFNKAMSDDNAVEASIKHSIDKNGFPGKIVRLPFKPVYQSCKSHDTSLTVVLKNLEAEEIFGEIQGDYIEFRSPATLNRQTEKPPAEKPIDLSGLGGAPESDLMKAARQHMENMTPEQKDDIQKKVDNMSPEEKANLIKLVSQQFNPIPPGTK